MMDDSNHSPYLADILTQAASLQNALLRFDPKSLAPLFQAIRNGHYDRLVLTGMGASFYSLYPAWLLLTRSGLPTIWVDTAELLHHAWPLVTRRTLLWVVSQSGRSAEIIGLLEKLRDTQPAALLATTNDLESPLSQVGAAIDALSVVMPIYAAPETTVSTRTYVNTVALSQLAAVAMCGQDLAPIYTSFKITVEAMAAFLEDWETHLQFIEDRLGAPRHLVFLGRGSSLATAYCGALICGEAARFPAIGMPAGEFRHGPLETCDPDLTVILFAGPPETIHLNQRLAQDLGRCGARVHWVGQELEGVSSLPVPTVLGVGLPLVELLPVQLVSLHLAQQAGVVPGQFRHIGKVTLEE